MTIVVSIASIVLFEFFHEICEKFGIYCNYDRFATNMNSKCAYFNSPSNCVGSNGVDCFNFNWGPNSLNWLFPPPRLIIPAIQHLKNCNGIGLLLTPDWKSSSFYPYLISPEVSRYVRREIEFDGKNCFVHGSDKSSFFGPEFNARVSVRHFDFLNSKNILGEGRC